MSPLRFRNPVLADLPALLALLADDEVARSRSGYTEEITPEVLRAFEEITEDPNNELLIAEREGTLVATLQLTYIPGLSRGGMRRALIEAVRVKSDVRNQKIGEALMGEAARRAKARGCGLIQLTTDKRRGAAQRFYLRLGYVASHEGMKRLL